MVPGSLGLPKTPRQRTRLDEDGFGFAAEMCYYTLLVALWRCIRENQTSRDPANTPFF